MPAATAPGPQPRMTNTRELLVKGGAALGVVALATCVTSGVVLLTASSAESGLTSYADTVLAEQFESERGDELLAPKMEEDDQIARSLPDEHRP